MQISGHDEEFRKEIMERTVKKSEIELSNSLNNKRKICRNREEREKMCEERVGKRTKDLWFRKRTNVKDQL